MELFLELFLNILGHFLKVKIQNWNIFFLLGGGGGLLTFNYFWDIPDTSDILWGKQLMLG